MKIRILKPLAAALLCSCGGDTDNARRVNVFIGTDANGHTYPGAVAPFGMVQPSPETGRVGWDYCSGYRYGDGKIISFGQTHLSGTGCPDSGDAAFMPFVGDPRRSDFSSGFKKESEKASPGFYSVVLDDAKCAVSLSASGRAAIYEIEFFEGGGGIFFDFQSGMFWRADPSGRVLESEVEMPDAFTVVGRQKVKSFTAREIWFAVKFDKPVKERIVLPSKPNCKGQRWSLLFGLKKGDVLRVKTAVSTASADGALANLETLPHWDVSKSAAQTRAEWNAVLSRIDIDASETQKAVFYTALYHAFVSPNNIADVGGKYRGADGKVAISSNASGKYYTNLSLWDTYRAVIPLTAILVPEKLSEFANSMLDHFDAVGVLPTNAYWGKETWCMIGNHAVSALAGCIQRGIGGFDRERALRAMISSSEKNHNKSDFSALEKYGYYPFDLCNPESVSKTLENCFGDYCLSEAAKVMGRSDAAEKFARRAGYYKNIFDPSTGFMRGRDSKGKWREPFNPFEYSHAETFGGDYTEGNAWQYNFHVQHDAEGLIKLFGGREKFVNALDKMFGAVDSRKEGEYRKTRDVTGMIGQYAHGNEPSHHVAYLYALAGRPDRTAEIVRKICSELYSNAPDGLCGNDDCGQMSAWYVFSALGFYPVNPNGLEYVLGAPQIAGATIKLAGGKTFKMRAHNLSEKNLYVKSVKVNGKEYKGAAIAHSMFVEGGALEFFMGET